MHASPRSFFGQRRPGHANNPGGARNTILDSFRGEILWEWMVGGIFVEHPYTGAYDVRIKDTKHPITKGTPKKFKFIST